MREKLTRMIDQHGILLTSRDVARRLNVVPDRVRQLARSGRLQASVTTESGQRLFSEAEVARYRREVSQVRSVERV